MQTYLEVCLHTGHSEHRWFQGGRYAPLSQNWGRSMTSLICDWLNFKFYSADSADSAVSNTALENGTNRLHFNVRIPNVVSKIKLNVNNVKYLKCEGHGPRGAPIPTQILPGPRRHLSRYLVTELESNFEVIKICASNFGSFKVYTLFILSIFN